MNTAFCFSVAPFVIGERISWAVNLSIIANIVIEIQTNDLLYNLVQGKQDRIWIIESGSLPGPPTLNTT